MSQPCPVCGGEVSVHPKAIVEATVCESGESCPACGWAYEFSYGHSSEWIAPEEFSWSWTETPEEREERRGRRLDAINRRRAEVMKP